MAKSSAPPEPRNPLIPLHPEVLKHHEETLLNPMREWREGGRVPPVLLITGLAGVGKREIATYLAQWVLCERAGFAASSTDSQEDSFDLFGASAPAPAAPPVLNDKPRPCGECVACTRALRGSWVDFTEIRPEEEDEESGSGVLKIDQFRKIKASVGFGAHEGRYRIISVPNADRMTPQAANSLLKLLEEPPKGWIFFLTASDPTLVLPTVLSRCQTLRLKPFSNEELRTILISSEITAVRAALCASLAQGSWRKAEAFADDEIWEQRKGIFEFLLHPVRALNPLLDWAAQSGPQLELLISQLEQVTADLVRWSVSEAVLKPESYEWSNSDGKEALVSHARRVATLRGTPEAARSFWLARAEELARARRRSGAPLNRKLLVQDLLAPWLSVG